ncbi:MAG TPA: DUF3017 domain-containing protein [Actinomycetes bacterium]
MTAGPDPGLGPPPIRGGWVARQWPLLLVLGGGATGLAVVALDHFRTGCLLLGCAVLFAALVRAVLPERRVGLLVVRSRVLDVAVLLTLAMGLIVLSVVVPPARG